MQIVKCLSLTSNSKNWLENSSKPKILHVFDKVCNLINEKREVLSIVNTEIGNGPFNLVIEDDILFSRYLGVESSISIIHNQINLADLSINTGNTRFWNSRPDWKRLHDKKEKIADRLERFPIPAPQFPNSLARSFSSALADADRLTTKNIASKLAGLGEGLTPAGDDFMMGALHASWIVHPPEIASALAREIVETAPALTTSLSAAWLRSAGKGEAGILWHNFFNALITDDPQAIEIQIAKLLSIGHTSGADAFAGFMSTLMHAEEKSCPF